MIISSISSKVLSFKYASLLVMSLITCSISGYAQFSNITSAGSYGQGSNLWSSHANAKSVFEKQLRDRYEKDVDSPDIGGYHRIKDNILLFEKLQKVFIGYFNNYELFSVTYTSDPRWGAINKFPKLYAVDMLKKQVVQWNSQAEFLTFLNSSKNHIDNLDKCYLFLYLYHDVMKHSQINITKPEYNI